MLGCPEAEKIMCNLKMIFKNIRIYSNKGAAEAAPVYIISRSSGRHACHLCGRHVCYPCGRRVCHPWAVVLAVPAASAWRTRRAVASAAIIPEKAIKILWHIKRLLFIKICNGGIKGAKPLYVYPLCTDSSVHRGWT